MERLGSGGRSVLIDASVSCVTLNHVHASKTIVVTPFLKRLRNARYICHVDSPPTDLLSCTVFSQTRTPRSRGTDEQQPVARGQVTAHPGRIHPRHLGSDRGRHTRRRSPRYGGLTSWVLSFVCVQPCPDLFCSFMSFVSAECVEYGLKIFKLAQSCSSKSVDDRMT